MEHLDIIGRTVGHYRILEKIGAGGMGEVYRAHDERLDRDVALKVLPADALADEPARKRFRKEALALSKLNHPNIETVHDFDTQDGVDFLVMEHIAGVTLDDKLAAGALSEKEAARLGAQLAEGLAAAHEQGVVHRDLKPGNLRITPDGRLKILDFGLAKLLRPVSEAAPTQSLTEIQGITGTLPYMAPEQLQGEPADARNDIYAAGAVLYEMATGQRAFPEKQTAQLMDAILHTAPVTPSRFQPRLSAELERIILKCLEKEAENRYQSVKELLVDLRRLGLPTAAVAAPPRRPLARRLQWAAGLAAAAVLGVLVGLNVGGVRDRLFGVGRAGQIQSLAVLPLDNLMGDLAQDYFVDGMTEALIADLAQIGPLRVISRTSVMRYKGTKKSVPEIAKELKVDAVVEGSVLRAGDQVRITAQLIGAVPERHLWAKNYERDLRDILALQREVARAIASEVRLKLTPQQQARLASGRPVNPHAYEASLKGTYHCRRPGEEKKGLEFFEQAIGLDSRYAPAYAGLAVCYHVIAFSGILPPNEAYPKAKAAALKAIELDETLPEGHRAMAQVSLHHDWNWAEAEKEYRRALELNPNSGDVHHVYAHYLMAVGRGKEAVAETLRAFELDPVNLRLSACRGWHCLYTGKLDLAVEYLRKTLEMNPKLVFVHEWLGQVYEQKGMYKEAIAEFETAVTLSGGSTMSLAGLGRAYAVAGNRRGAENVLAQLKERLKQGYVPAYEIAAIYTGVGDKKQTFEWLEKAYKERSVLLVHINWDPRFDSLRWDPRLADLTRRIGLPQAETRKAKLENRKKETEKG